MSLNDSQPWDEELRKEMLERLTPVFVYKLCLDLKVTLLSDL